jgi:uncharacterized protein (DUF952 family)
MILHITTKKEWEKAQIEGQYIAPSLDTNGFIHCSTINQTADTANLFFKGQSGLLLLCIDEKKLKSECRYEDPAGNGVAQHDPRNGSLFPHIYGPINLSSVIAVTDFPSNGNEIFELPKDIEKIRF